MSNTTSLEFDPIEAGPVDPTRGLGAQLIAREAVISAQAEVQWISYRVAIVKTQDRSILIDGTTVSESILGAVIADNKTFTKEFLASQGVSTPHGKVVRSAEEALKFSRNIASSIVVKPASGSRGKGVSVDVFEESDIMRAYHVARGVNGEVLVEEFINIERELRCIGTPREFVSAYERVLPQVIGDGESSIGALIERKNELKALNPLLRKHLIPVDDTLEYTLHAQDLSLASVVDRGEVVTVRNVGGLSGGGEPHECSGEVSNEIKNTVVKAIRAVPGLNWGGVDLAIDRVTGKAYVIELNVNAGFSGSIFPESGKPVDVAGRAWQERWSRSLPTPTTVGSAPAALPRPEPLGTKFPDVGFRKGEALLTTLLWKVGDKEGFDLERRGGSLVRVNRGGRDQWFTLGMRGKDDVLSTQRLVRKHAATRKTLRYGGIRQVRAILVSSRSSREKIDQFIPKHAGQFAITRADSEWRGPNSHVVMRSELNSISAQPGKWVVQPRWTGLRVRVFSSRNQVFAVTADGGTGTISDEALNASAQTALEALRAVPELRWGAVDVYLTRASLDGGAEEGGVVEGMQLNPRLASSDILLAGSFSRMVRWLMSDGLAV